ncbi:hypothetical protein BXA22_10130 [Edwardsiella piscicida]|nr:hypothetical protein BXA22_10130 [Edwardsiella piscicida]GAJ63972.1 hypothetical protein HI13_contig00010-0039 [Edwardsiella piscicida]
MAAGGRGEAERARYRAYDGGGSVDVGARRRRGMLCAPAGVVAVGLRTLPAAVSRAGGADCLRDGVIGGLTAPLRRQRGISGACR